MDLKMLPADNETAPELTVTVKIYSDGRRTVDGVGADGQPLPLGGLRRALREASDHMEDRFLATLAETAARKVVAEIAAKSNRNGFFNFLKGAR